MDDAVQVVTPTTKMVYEIALYGALNAAEDVSDELDDEEFREMFDRWLQEVKTKAWDEGYYQGVRDNETEQEPADNPYRSDSDRP